MNTPHERLTRTTFSLPLGEVHALVGGAVNARPLLFLHGFPDHPPTAVPFLERLAETHRVVAPWLRGYAPSLHVGVTRRKEETKSTSGGSGSFTELGHYEQVVTLPEPVKSSEMKVDRHDHEIVITIPKAKTG